MELFSASGGKGGMRLVIVGSARCVWDDLEKLWPVTDDVMAINDLIMHYPEKLTHAYSNDFEMLNKWVDARRPMAKQLDEKLRKHCCFPCEGAEKWDIKVQGNSGICAVYVGQALGYEEIVLCGVPQDDTGHYFDPPWVKTNYGKSTRKRPGSDQIRYWSNVKGKVYSMSGRTKEVLGDGS